MVEKIEKIKIILEAEDFIFRFFCLKTTEANISGNIAFMNYGVLPGINYTYERFIFDLPYQHGILDISICPTINVRANNVSGQFSIAYFLK